MSNIEFTTDNYTLLYFSDRKNVMSDDINIIVLPKADRIKCQNGVFNKKKFELFFKEEIVLINELYYTWFHAIFALIKSRPDTNLIEISIFSMAKCVSTNFDHEYMLSLIEEPDYLYSDKLKNYAELYFKKNFNPNAHCFRSYDKIYDELNEEPSLSIRYGTVQQYIHKLVEKGSTLMNTITIIPSIDRVIINDPAVIIFWSDGSKTTGKCMKNDTFNPEVGFAMAISKKYFEIVGCENPRAEFKNQLKKATDQSKKTAEKKALKQKLKEKVVEND